MHGKVPENRETMMLIILSFKAGTAWQKPDPEPQPYER
jgi:hypothetical protein